MDHLLHQLSTTKCNNQHLECIALKDKIMNAIATGIVFTNDFVDKYINFLASTHLYGYYYQYGSENKLCINVTARYLDALIALFQTGVYPTTNGLNLLIKHCALAAIEFLFDGPIAATDLYLTYAINNNMRPVAKYLLTKLELSDTHIQLLATKNWTEEINIILDQKIMPSENSLIAAINFKYDDTILLLMNYGAPLTKKVFDTACVHNNIKIIQACIENEIKPDANSFNSLFVNYAPYYKAKYTETSNPTITKIIDLFVSTGYKITYNDVVLATRKKVSINNVEHYGIVFDDAFMAICSESSFYPSNIKIKPNISCLATECGKSGNLTVIKKLIGDGIKPTVECLENACKIKQNIQTIRYLTTSCGLVPNNKCLENIAYILGNSTFNLIVDAYVKKHPETIQIKKNDENLKDENLKNDNIIHKIIDDDTVELHSDVEDAIINNLKEKPVKKNSNKSDSDSSGEKMLVIAKKTKKVSKKIDIEDIEIISKKEIKSPKKNIVAIKKSDKIIDARKKQHLSKNLIDFLDVIGKNTDMTFIEIRKRMTKYIVENKLLDPTDATLVKIDDKIAKHFQLQKNAYFSFNQIEDIIKSNIITEVVETK